MVFHKSRRINVVWMMSVWYLEFKSNSCLVPVWSARSPVVHLHVEAGQRSAAVWWEQPRGDCNTDPGSAGLTLLTLSSSRCWSEHGAAGQPGYRLPGHLLAPSTVRHFSQCHHTSTTHPPASTTPHQPPAGDLQYLAVVPGVGGALSDRRVATVCSEVNDARPDKFSWN